jgi:tRNA threonylcarbamoyl adenosine modification protein YjeE
MNSDMTYSISTGSSEETARLGARLARLLKGGETIELVGDLGAGKTTLVQGLVHAMGFKDDVPSPTFTLSRSYPVRDGLTVHHFDLYRLHGHDIVSDELTEATEDTQAVTVVEWPDHGDANLPADRIRIELRYGADESAREISVGGPSNFIKELKHVSGSSDR